MNERETLLEVVDLKKYYPLKRDKLFGKRKVAKALDGVSFDLYKGETLGIVGESGCGKSTLGKAIINLEEPTAGEIFFKGEEIIGLPSKKFDKYRKNMQMIFQDPFASLNPRQRVGDILEEVFLVHTNLGKEERRERALELLTDVGLKEEQYENYPHEFSGGQRQRIGIARAIALNPEMIVCDEAISALDVSIQAQVLRILERIKRKYHMTYLFITHDLGVGKHFCDRLMVMYLGQVMEIGSSSTLYKDAKHPYTKGLLASAPRPKVEKNRETIVLEGEVPSLINPPKGCPFNTRCKEAKDICYKEKPKVREVSRDHLVACHNY